MRTRNIKGHNFITCLINDVLYGFQIKLLYQFNSMSANTFFCFSTIPVFFVKFGKSLKITLSVSRQGVMYLRQFWIKLSRWTALTWNSMSMLRRFLNKSILCLKASIRWWCSRNNWQIKWFGQAHMKASIPWWCNTNNWQIKRFGQAHLIILP